MTTAERRPFAARAAAAAKRAVRRGSSAAAPDAEVDRLVREVERLRRQTHQLRDRAERRSTGPERWHRPAPEKGVAAILRSGLFDLPWYLSQVQLPAETSEAEAAAHYLETGHGEGASPTPLFVADFYLSQVRADPGYGTRRQISSAPLVHYLERGARRGLSPHPAFDAAAYLTDHPEAADHPGGPLRHFLGADDGRTAAEVPLPKGARAGADVEPRRRTAEELLATAHTVATTLRATRGHLHLERDRDEFDHDAEARLKAELRSRALAPHEQPLVSVVLPTKDRADSLAPALDSVLAQTYGRLELLVVDDGSSDGTADLLAAYDDPRLVVLRHDESRGVAAARNAALRQARGDLVAYLDSDNTWREDFLELLVTAMVREGHAVAYAMSELVEEGGEGRRVYRGMPFSREALLERNYIDCIVLVHRRELLERTGLFDETLRRNVDWELFIRLAREVDFAFVPVIATEYDVWDTRGDRITTEVPPSYRHVVRQRALVDWSRAASRLPDRDPDLLSVVVVARRDATTALATARRARRTARGRVECVVVDDHLPAGEGARLLVSAEQDDWLRVHRLSAETSTEVARNLGATLARGRVLAFLTEEAWCQPGWDQPLVAALAEAPAAQPVVLDDGGTVWSAGVHFLPDGTAVELHRHLPGDAPEVRGTRPVDAVSHACVVVTAEDLVALEGFDPLFLNHRAGGELSLRLAERHDRLPVCVGDSQVALREPVEDPSGPRPRRTVSSRDNVRFLREAWERRAVGTRADARLAEDALTVLGLLQEDRSAEPAHPLLVRQREDRPLRWAIKIGASEVVTREHWGDWHFAMALRDSLERLGHHVTIDCRDRWYRPTSHLDDVVLVLRGLSYYEVSPQQINVSWVISHPELVSARELDAYDLAFGASTRWCERTSRRSSTPVELLLQCTDHRRFHPVEPDPERRHELLAVANARGGTPPRPRAAVEAALRAGLVPAVYGLRWKGLLPAGAWRGPYIPNDDLPAVYGAAGAVLNDHWDDMRENGLLSNRLFDLAACDARVISDHLPEIADVFGDVVATFRRPEEIPALLRRHLEESPERREARQALGEHVRREHTFDARARVLSERVLEAHARALPRQRAGLAARR